MCLHTGLLITVCRLMQTCSEDEQQIESQWMLVVMDLDGTKLNRYNALLNIVVKQP